MELTEAGLQIPEDLKARYHAICVCAAVNEPFPHDVCVREEKRYIERIARLEAENACLTKGGCGKPGHTTCSGDEGTCYCLTCQLEVENAALKARVERLSEPVSDEEWREASSKAHAQAARKDHGNWIAAPSEGAIASVLIAARVKETDHENSQDHKG